MRFKLGQNSGLMLGWHFSLNVNFDQVCNHGCQLTNHLLVPPLLLAQYQKIFGACSV
jgi:hypothetical protein